jgi:hypothetical protein
VLWLFFLLMGMPPFKYIPKPFGIWANKKSENDIPILFGYLRLPMARPMSFSQWEHGSQ